MSHIPLETTTKNKRWPYTGAPAFHGKKVHVLSGAMFRNVVAYLAQAGFEKAKGVEDADLVVFTGGTDINPGLYSQQPIEEVKFFDRERDTFEEAIFNECVKRSIPMYGICRGAQFLHAMNGGELWQDVNNHAGPAHDIYDIDEDYTVLATSLHHQMLKHNDKMDLIAITDKRVATRFKDENLFIDLTKDDPDGKKGDLDLEYEIEVEACRYDDTKCFLVQGHPEVGDASYRSWSLHKLHDFMTEVKVNDSKSIIATAAETVKKMIG